MFQIWIIFFLLGLTSSQTCNPAICSCTNNICTSCLASFLYLANASCQPCPYECGSCSSQSNCTSCQSSYFLWNGSCQLCSQNCLTCSNSACLACMSGYALVGSVCVACSGEDVLTCNSAGVVLSCVSGYWQNGNSCSPCRQFCLVCSSPSNCLQCQAGFMVAISFGSYCVMCGTGCSICSSSGCSQCFYNYQLVSGNCVSISQNCSLIQQCMDCMVGGSGQIVCESCVFPYYVQNGVCVDGASLLCPNGAAGPMFYQCLNSCGTNAYELQALGTNMVCLPLPWVGSLSQIYLNAYEPIFSGYLYQTLNQLVYFDQAANSVQVGSSTIGLSLVLSSYYKIVVSFKMIAVGSAGSNISVTIQFIDNSSNSEQYVSYELIEMANQPFYLSQTTKVIKDQLVSISIVSAIANQTRNPIVGLAECIVQVYPCPSNCRMCFNAELCIECQSAYFNTPNYLCVTNCNGYLQLYLPNGNALNYTSKECVLSCPSSFYAWQNSSVYICQPCQGLCVTCLSSTQCLSCVEGYLYYQISFECLTNCPNTHYNSSGVCTLCNAPCATCLNAFSCLSCSIGFYSSGQCVSSCPTGTFENMTGNTCDNCDSKCSACEGSSTFCLACNEPYLLFQSSCILNCLSNLYYESDGTCQSCLSPCMECVNSSSCLSCMVGFLFGEGCLTSCPTGYFANGLSSTCELCQNGCLTCESATICLSCPNSTNLYNYQCLPICPQGTYSSNSLCMSCIEPCSSCINQSYCLSCSVGYLSEVTVGSCVSVCEDGYYADSANMSCAPCGSTCQTCLGGPSICTSCLSSLLLEGSECIEVCDVGYFNYSGNCLPCTFPCLSCSGSDSACESCQSSYILVNTSCVSQCPQLTYLSAGACAQCVLPCLDCSSQTECQSCATSETNQTYFYSGECLQICPSAYFADNSSLSCRSCGYPCLTCASQIACLSCLSGYLNPSTQWCEICSGQLFGNTITMECELCSSVMVGCQECLSDEECILCVNSTYLYNGSCITQQSCVGLTYYYADEIALECLPCVSPCITCLNSSYCTACLEGDLNEGNCVNICPDGLYVDDSVCYSCFALCLTCQNSTTCLTCNTSGSFPVYFSNQQLCINASSCLTGYYIDNSLGWPVCSQCVAPCQTCLNASYCLTCLSGINNMGSCISICPSGYYANSNLTNPSCEPCSTNCFKCTLSASSCTACFGSEYLKNGTCVSSCGDGFYLDSSTYQCFQCIDPCLTCSSASTCLSCLNSSYLLYFGQCLLACPDGTYQQNFTCQVCPSSCLTCVLSNSSIECIQCASGMFMSMAAVGNCQASCGIKEYGDNVTHNCYGCISPCVSCLSAISCLSCVNGYLLVQTQCLAISRCPQGTYLLNSSCLSSCGELWAVEVSASCESECIPPGLKLVESGWLCVSGCPSGYYVNVNYTCSQCVGNSCSDLLGVALQVKSIFNVLYVKISFSEDLDGQVLQNGGLQILLSPESARLLQQTEVTYSVSVVNLNAVWLMLSVNYSISNSILWVVFADYYTFNMPLQQLNYSVTIDSFDLYTAEEEDNGKAFQTYSEIMSLIMLVIFMMDLLLNSGYLSYLIIDYYQLLFMILFLSIDYPPNLNHFLYGFRYSHYLFLPQIFRSSPDNQYSTSTPDKFGVIVPDVQFLNNTGPSFIVIGAVLGLLILSKLIQEVLRRVEGCHSNKVGDELGATVGEGRFLRCLQGVISRFKWNYFNDVTYIVYFSLMLFSFSQFYDLSWPSGEAFDVLSIILSFVFIMVGMLFPPALGYFLHREKENLIERSLQREKAQLRQKIAGQVLSWRESNEGENVKDNYLQGEGSIGDKESEEKEGQNYEILTDFKCFVSGVKLKVKTGFYHIPIKYSKKLIFACLMVYCSEYPSYVLSVAMMVCLINILIVVILKPYRLTFEQIIYPIFDCLYLLVFLVICIMQLQVLGLSETEKLNAGYLAIGLCILLSVLLSVHNIVMNVVEAIKFFCKVDYFSSYYQAEYVETSQNDEQTEQVTNTPLNKEGMEKVEESESMVSGLDIYLRKESSAPKYLIKCLKPEQQGEVLGKMTSANDQKEIKIRDIQLDEDMGEKSEHVEESISKHNIFMNIQTIEIDEQGGEQHD